MFLPIRDSPNPPGKPFVTWALIALNVVVFVLVTMPLSSLNVDLSDPALREFVARHPGVLQSIARGDLPSQYELFIERYGYIPARGGVLTLFTCMFLHGSFMHLFGNMLFLWIYGDNVEARLGRIGYLVAYLATGLAATFGNTALDPDSTTVTIGASGAISGVLGLYFVFFPRNVVYVFVFLFPFLMTTVQFGARLVLGFYLVVDNLLPLFLQGGVTAGGGVAYGAHIGGFVAGFGIAHAIGARGAERVEHATIPQRPRVRPRTPEALTVADLLRHGRYADAAQRYFEADGRVELSTSHGLELGQWLAEHDHPTAALQVFRRMIAQSPKGRDGAWAHVGAGYVQARYRGQLTAAAQHFLDAIDLDPKGEAGARAREALARIDGTR